MVLREAIFSRGCNPGQKITTFCVNVIYRRTRNIFYMQNGNLTSYYVNEVIITELLTESVKSIWILN